jgi:predicted hotdog family 3-hydroxylacyl-ACP dehydratase
MVADKLSLAFPDQDQAAGFAGFSGMPAARFLYHEPPMALLDRVVEVGPDSAVCSCIVNEENPFYCSSRGVPSWVGIEFMAQCIAVSAGARAVLANKPLPVGLLLGTMAFHSRINRFESAAIYLAHCSNLVKDDQGLGSFDCRISLENETIATARLTVKELTERDETHT